MKKQEGPKRTARGCTETWQELNKLLEVPQNDAAMLRWPNTLSGKTVSCFDTIQSQPGAAMLRWPNTLSGKTVSCFDTIQSQPGSTEDAAIAFWPLLVLITLVLRKLGNW
ncbi:hypothetical protein QE152_g36657 [Popillia japonica]|uniref:Uncharacterized protein n=1 Tax=Popillia japonica TaxID=7064 RepID=A0AAW1ID68_POPJA